MPQITQYTRQNTPAQLIQGRRATAADFGGDQTGLRAQAQAGSEMARSMEQLSNTVQNIQKKRDRMKYNEIMTEEALSIEQRKLELAQMEFDEDTDFVSTYDNEFQERMEVLSERVPPSMQEQFQSDSNSLRLQFVQSGMKEQVRRAGVRSKLRFENTIEKASNLVALNPDQYDSARAMVESQVQSLPNMAPEDRDVLLDDAVGRIAASRAQTLVTQNPEQFIKDAKEGKHDNLSDIGKYIGAAERQIETNKKRAEKALIESREADTATKLNNENELSELFADPETSYDEKVAAVNRLDLQGEIRDDFAVEARRYLKSENEINAVTNSDAIADIVTRMYDLNEIAELSPNDYLEGVADIKKEIIAKRADGDLSREDEIKLNQQMKSLMSAKVAGATNDISYSFGEARKMIDQQLPPDMRGEAVRQLFYATEQERIEAQEDRDKRKALKDAYKLKARQIIDEINNTRRDRVINSVNTVNQPVEDVDAFLESKGYTMDDVRETAAKYGLTEQQVIEQMRLK